MTAKMPDLGDDWNLDDMFVDSDDYTELAAALARLAEYASLKAASMRFRNSGLMSHARVIETKMESRYELLPNNWRW